MSGSPIYQVNATNGDSRVDSAKYAAIASEFRDKRKSSLTGKNKGLFARLICCFSGKNEEELAKQGQIGQPDPKKSPTLKESAGPTPGYENYNHSPNYSSGFNLMPPPRPEDVGKKVLVLDLDETLVHSSFKPVPGADFIIPVEIEGIVHQVYVRKRPHVDEFMKRVGQIFEVNVFTASLSKYADPVLDLLDKHKVVSSRLFREACANHLGNYVKDMSRLGRDMNKVVIIDNSPASYLFQPQNAIPITSWFDDNSDTELLDLLPFLEELAKCDSVYTLLDFRRQYFTSGM